MYASRAKLKKTIPNEPGKKEQPILGYKYEKDGTKTLVVKGIKDRYQEAQDALPGVEIKTLIDRYSKGDIAALERVKGIYGDFTETPTTMVEALNTVQNATEAFNKLPKEIRAKFENSIDQFIAAIGTEKFKAAFEKPEPIGETIVPEDIKE